MFKMYGFSLFGQSIKEVTSLEAMRANVQTYAIDNFYAYLAIHFGVVILIIVLWILFRLVKRSIVNSNDDILLAWVLLLIIYGIFENQIVDLRIAFPLVIIMSGILKSKDLFFRDSGKNRSLLSGSRKRVSIKTHR